jgi:hypothetical protein
VLVQLCIANISKSGCLIQKFPLVNNTSDMNKPLSTAQKSYIDTSISGLINLAPSTLDTLSELGLALGNDPNFSTSITSLINTKATNQ